MFVSDKRRGEAITYRGRLGLLVTLWFSLREVIGREHRRGRWASCRPKAYNGDFIIGLGFGLGEDGLVRMLRCGQKACRLHIYHLDIVVALWLGIGEDGFEVVRKQVPKWNGAGSGVLRKCRPDVVGWASRYFYCLRCSTSQRREGLDKKRNTHYRPVGSWQESELKGLVGVRGQVDLKDVAWVGLRLLCHGKTRQA